MPGGALAVLASTRAARAVPLHWRCSAGVIRASDEKMCCWVRREEWFFVTTLAMRTRVDANRKEPDRRCCRDADASEVSHPRALPGND